MALKSIFARPSIPSFVSIDNGACYAVDSFRQFAATYAFLHTKSNPSYTQRNGDLKKVEQIAKNLLRKTSDPFLALLAYKATPKQMGYSPAQLFMGRQQRTILPLPGSCS